MITKEQLEEIERTVIALVEDVIGQPAEVGYRGASSKPGYDLLNIQVKVRKEYPEAETPPTLGIQVQETIDTTEHVGG